MENKRYPCKTQRCKRTVTESDYKIYKRSYCYICQRKRTENNKKPVLKPIPKDDKELDELCATLGSTNQ